MKRPLNPVGSQYPRNMWGGGICFGPDAEQESRDFADWLRGKGFAVSGEVHHFTARFSEVLIFHRVREDPHFGCPHYFGGPTYEERAALYSEWLAA